MSKIFFVLSVLPVFVWGQSTLFSENFESSTYAFTLNTSSQNSVSGTNGFNYWVVNNAYNGGNGSFTCLGFPFAFTANPTPSQISGITNQPNSKYMHIVSDAAVSSNINNAVFIAADGLCSNPENYFTEMSNSISTVGFDSVEFSFYWLCAGGAQSYGEIYFSVNGGSSWTLINQPQFLNNSSNWSQQKISLPNFAQQSNLKFGFRFVNQTTTSASDPALSIDEIKVTGFTLQAPASIQSIQLSSTSICAGQTALLTYILSGPFNSGNIFTVQLSDINGNFLNPTVIGQITSSVSSILNVSILQNTLAGSNYQIRLISSNPQTTGPSLPVSILAQVSAGNLVVSRDTICPFENATISLQGTNAVQSVVWEQSVDGIQFTSSTYNGLSFNTGPLFNTLYVRGIVSGICGVDTSVVGRVVVSNLPQAQFVFNVLANNTVSFTNQSSGYTQLNWYFGDGDSSLLLNPTHVYPGPGTYFVELIATNAFGCSQTYSDSIIIGTTNINLKQFDQVQIFPNPFKDQLLLSDCNSFNSVFEVHIYDLQGKSILNDTMSLNQPIQTSQWQSGVYWVEIKKDGKLIRVQKMIKW